MAEIYLSDKDLYTEATRYKQMLSDLSNETQ